MVFQVLGFDCQRPELNLVHVGDLLELLTKRLGDLWIDVEALREVEKLHVERH